MEANNQFEIKQYCNRYAYSDVYPCEVVKVISPRKVLLRRMDTVLKQKAVMEGVGGFAANFDNYTQRWEYVSNPENTVFEITLTKKGWGNGSYKMSDKPIMFYDYNF